VPRLLRALGTLVLALGVVVMHSLGVGHHGPTPSAATASATATAPAVTAHHAAGHSVAGHGTVDAPASVAVEGHGPGLATAATAATARGAMVTCLAVLPFLLLLRRPGDRAWFARALASVTRPLAGLPSSFFCLPPGRAAPSLSELCILRT
jgi:hypothetical protein